jgi:hypothetical protein
VLIAMADWSEKNLARFYAGANLVMSTL